MEVVRISPKRLKRQQEATGYHKGWSTLGHALFGLPFVGIGIWLSGMGLGIIPHDPDKLNAPLWILTVIGLSFGAGGLVVWGMAFKHFQMEQKLKALQARYPGDAAMADFPWDRSGFSPSRWGPVRKAAFGMGFMIVFLSAFNWFAFGAGDAPIFVKLIVGLFDLFLIWGIFYTIYLALHALKFGETRLLFDRFPYHANDSVELKIQVPPVLHKAKSATLSMRGIREFYEVSGHGKNRSKRLVHEAHYEAIQELDSGELINWPDMIASHWTLPEDARETDLTSKEPFYWELELKLDLPGIDLKQRYLLPIYQS